MKMVRSAIFQIDVELQRIFVLLRQEAELQLHTLLQWMMRGFMKMRLMIQPAVFRITLVMLLLAELHLRHHLLQEVLQLYQVILMGSLEVLKSFQDYFQRQTKMAFMQIQQCMGKDLWTWPLQPPL